MSLAQRLALDDAAVRDSASPILGPGFALRPESEHSGMFRIFFYIFCYNNMNLFPKCVRELWCTAVVVVCYRKGTGDMVKRYLIATGVPLWLVLECLS